jgi:hypothetical protein
MHSIIDTLADNQLLLWGTAYVIVKWTLGVWVFRRIRTSTKVREFRLTRSVPGALRMRPR